MTQGIVSEPTTGLSAFAEALIRAVDGEIQATVFPRHKINKLSPSFPWDHRTLANKGFLGLGIQGRELVGGRVFVTKVALLEFLRRELFKPGKQRQSEGRPINECLDFFERLEA